MPVSILHVLRALPVFAGIALHVLFGLLFAILAFPLLAQPARNRVIRGWSRVLLAIVGLRLNLRGEPVDPRLAPSGILRGSVGRVLVSNHTSWLDIYALNAVVPTRFVAKADIASWPLLGWLVAQAGTLFVERGRRHAVAAINRMVAERLRDGETVGVFPEGTTTDGSAVLPFHANLIQPAIDVHAEIRPIAIRYLQHGVPTRAAAYVGEETLVGSLWRVAGARGLSVEVHWLPPIPIAAGTRQAIGRAARAAVAEALGVPLDEVAQRAEARAGVAAAGAAPAEAPAPAVSPDGSGPDTPLARPGAPAS